MRYSSKYKVENIGSFKHKLLKWSEKFDTVMFMDSNNFDGSENKVKVKYDMICAIGEQDILQITSENYFKELQSFYDEKDDWIFGHLSYDLKNSTENLSSNNFDGIQMPDLNFFQPKFIFIIRDSELEILYHLDDTINVNADIVFSEINKTSILELTELPENLNLKSRISKKKYLNTVNKILRNIHKGDIFEMNFCQEFYSEETDINPLDIFLKLMKISPTPFASYYKFKNYYLLSASPERYISKEGSRIISQPIKGTIKRGIDKDDDLRLKKELENNPKERSENIMIVDLVRNDLSKSATKGSVKVEELCEIYTYPMVHQMISTISCTHNPDIGMVDIIRHSFPMGSMTGAPKIRAMELIEEYESTKRGLFSGSIGYFTPEGDMDFNVIIRSIIYNSRNKYLSYQVGSAITNKSDPEQEFEECIVKAHAMYKSLK